MALPERDVLLCRDCCCGTTTKHPDADHRAQRCAFAAHAAVGDFAAQQSADDAADDRPAYGAVVAGGPALLFVGHVRVMIVRVLLRGRRLLAHARQSKGDGRRGDESLTSHDALLSLPLQRTKFSLNGT